MSTGTTFEVFEKELNRLGNRGCDNLYAGLRHGTSSWLMA